MLYENLLNATCIRLHGNGRAYVIVSSLDWSTVLLMDNEILDVPVDHLSEDRFQKIKIHIEEIAKPPKETGQETGQEPELEPDQEPEFYDFTLHLVQVIYR